MKTKRIRKGINQRAIFRVPYAIIYIARDKDIKKVELESENVDSIQHA